jgi:hypothetical protein
MPVASHLKAKKKLKGQISERDSEIDDLKREMEALKGSIQPQTDHEPLKRPRVADFDTDEEYEDEMDKYEEQKTSSLTANLSNSNTQKEQLEKTQREISTAVEDHYGRAESLIKEHSISPEVYKTADSNVRKAVEAVIPNGGTNVVDFIISALGKDSEKVLFYLGRNEKKLAEFQSALVGDPRGIKASIFLGELKRGLNNNVKRTSQAPKPAANANGDTVSKGQSAVEKRKYEAAHKKGDIQGAYNIKKAAKASGVATNEWS